MSGLLQAQSRKFLDFLRENAETLARTVELTVDFMKKTPLPSGSLTQGQATNRGYTCNEFH